MGTSTKDDDRAKILPGVEGALVHLRYLGNNLAFLRVFDQYEIDVEMTKHRHSYINSGITKKLIEQGLVFYDRTDKDYKVL